MLLSIELYSSYSILYGGPLPSRLRSYVVGQIADDSIQEKLYPNVEAEYSLFFLSAIYLIEPIAHCQLSIPIATCQQQVSALYNTV